MMCGRCHGPAATGGRLAAAVLLVAAGVAGGCSWWGSGEAGPQPDEPGLYAVIGEGDTLRLDGDREWERRTWETRSDLDPGIAFMAYHPDLAAAGREPAALLRLQRVAWVRSEIVADGSVVPPRAGRWAATGLERLAVPLRYQVAGDGALLHAWPQAPLEPGLYALELHSPAGNVAARLGIAWPSVDRQAYASANCVDQIAAREPPFQPCTAEAALDGEGLRIFLHKPERRVGEQGEVLIIRGIVANDAGDARSVPALEGVLLDADGVELRRWRFDAATAAIDSGDSVPFETVVADPPSAVRRVNVRFAAAADGYQSTAAQ